MIPTADLIAPTTPRAFSCRCGRPIFFRNSVCLACHRPLGYDVQQRRLLTLEPADQEGLWREAESAPGESPVYRRCSLLDSAPACNWLVDPDDMYAGEPPQCRCCRLTRTLPDLSIAENGVAWGRIELAKRRLVSQLIGLGLPVRSRMEDPQLGLAFDLLHSTPGQHVLTGHEDGVITLDVEEADDATREQRRGQMHEPYRTLLGHLRHECGHYYWQLLVDNSPWLDACRALFGDDRLDYAQALQRHYAEGPPPDWAGTYVSTYASSHPWEDWAETWAHYLHLRDTLDTATSFGLDGERVELSYERYGIEVLDGTDDPQPQSFLRILNGWMELTGVLNELSRSMGVPDFYPFVLSAAVVRKLHFVHRVVSAATEAAGLPHMPNMAPPAQVNDNGNINNDASGLAPAGQSMQGSPSDDATLPTGQVPNQSPNQLPGQGPSQAPVQSNTSNQNDVSTMDAAESAVSTPA